MSRSSATRLHATSPMEPRLRKALMRSFDGSMIYSRNLRVLASPAEPDDQCRHAPFDAAFGRTDRDIGTTVPDMDMQVDSSLARRRHHCRQRVLRHRPRPGRPSLAILPSASTRMSIALQGVPAPKPTGFTLVRRKAACPLFHRSFRGPFEVWDRACRADRHRPSGAKARWRRRETASSSRPARYGCRPAAIIVPQVGNFPG